MWEIAENLHRAELTALERDEHVAEWIALADRKAKAAAGLRKKSDAVNGSLRNRDCTDHPQSGLFASSTNPVTGGSNGAVSHRLVSFKSKPIPLSRRCD